MSKPIILTKGQTISLIKQDGKNLNQCYVGLGWDIHESMNADLDAFAIEVDDEGRKIDLVYFGQLSSHDKAINHSGDNLTGAGEGDDEVINFDLNKVNSKTRKIIIAVNIYRANLSFSEIENAFIRLVDRNTNTEFSRYNLSTIKGNNYTMYMADLIRDDNGIWNFRAMGNPTSDKSIGEFTKRITYNQEDTNESNSGNRSGFFKKLFK